MTAAVSSSTAGANLPAREILINIYESVARIVQTDERLMAGLKAGEVKCIYYPVRGQEIIPAAAVAALAQSDYMVTTYRCLHDIVAKGVPLGEIMAEFLGRTGGASKGKGGNMHISHPASGLMVTTGIVGAGLPIANGLALASQMQSRTEVTVVMFGDGATSIGAVHEAMNLAALWDLPVIFLIQNNQYGEHTTRDGYTRSQKLWERGPALGLPGLAVDGNDPLAVYQAVKDAAERARNGGGPTLIECETYRLRGHTATTAAGYMDEADLKTAWDNDPVPRFRSNLISWGACTADELSVIDARIGAEVETAYSAALDSPSPDIAELKADVYADMRGIPQ